MKKDFGVNVFFGEDVFCNMQVDLQDFEPIAQVLLERGMAIEIYHLDTENPLCEYNGKFIVTDSDGYASLNSKH